MIYGCYGTTVINLNAVYDKNMHGTNIKVSTNVHGMIRERVHMDISEFGG